MVFSHGKQKCNENIHKKNGVLRQVENDNLKKNNDKCFRSDRLERAQTHPKKTAKPLKILDIFVGLTDETRDAHGSMKKKLKLK